MAKAKQARIKSVSFRSSVEIGHFQHAHVEASAEVGPGESASAVLDQVKLFVADELRRAKHGEREVVAKSGKFNDLVKGGF